MYAPADQVNIFQSTIFPILNLGACGFSLAMCFWHWRKLGYLPKECALALPALFAFGVGYILVVTRVIDNLVMLRGVLLFLLLVPGVSIWLRHKELQRG